jgi:fucose 4-O-acetylase-like acetyltransferase
MSTGASSLARSETADLVKGSAIVFVVVGHYLPPDSPPWWLALHDLVYLFHMPVFFFVAGYIYRLRPQKYYREYLAGKAHRLLVPYVVVAGIYLAAKLIVSTRTDQSYPVTPSTVANLIMDPAHSFAPFLWFLPVLFAVCAVFPLARKLGRVVAGTSLLLAVGLYLLVDNDQAAGFLTGYLYFGAGALVAGRFDLDRQVPRHAAILSIGGFALMTVVALSWRFGSGWSGKPRWLLLSTIGTAATVLACQSLRVRRDANLEAGRAVDRSAWIHGLLFLASSTLTIYLFHTMSQGAAKQLLPMLPFSMRAVVLVIVGALLPVLLEVFVLRRSEVLASLFLGRSWPKRWVQYLHADRFISPMRPAQFQRTVVRQTRHRNLSRSR